MMHLSALVALLPALAAAQNPFTQYLTETDSNGVVTGMPTLPAHQSAASIPAGYTDGVATVWVGPSEYAVISVSDGSTDIISAYTSTGRGGEAEETDTTTATTVEATTTATDTETETDRVTVPTNSIYTRTTASTDTETETETDTTTRARTTETETSTTRNGRMTTTATETTGRGAPQQTTESEEAGMVGAAVAPGAVVAAAGVLLAFL